MNMLKEYSVQIEYRNLNDPDIFPLYVSQPFPEFWTISQGGHNVQLECSLQRRFDFQQPADANYHIIKYFHTFSFSKEKLGAHFHICSKYLPCPNHFLTSKEAKKTFPTTLILSFPWPDSTK